MGRKRQAATRHYKYLGGVFCPADGCIYCVPSDAEYVLRIDPAKGEAVEIGESLQGKVGYESNKWQNGFVAGDGRIYGIPLKADSVLCVEPDTERVYTVGSGLAGFDKWEGGVLAGGAVYCMPLKSKHVLRIAPAADAAPKPVDAAAAPAAAPPEAAPAHDALLPWLSTEDELGLLVRERLEADGYVVLPAVLSRDECAAALEKMWSFVEGVSPAVRRDAPDTWYPSAEGAADPWPHSGWKSFSDMFQDNGAGWLFGDERELLAERVFSKLYGTRELHASKEGFTFHRPTAAAATRSSARRRTSAASRRAPTTAAPTSTRATRARGCSASRARPRCSTSRRTTAASSAGPAPTATTARSPRGSGAAARRGCRSPTPSSTRCAPPASRRAASPSAPVTSSCGAPTSPTPAPSPSASATASAPSSTRRCSPPRSRRAPRPPRR